MDVTHRVVAGWILHERLGSGGFGEVWRARRRHVDLYRALKLMPVSSEAAFASWRHEIGRLEGLSHPNVVRFYDADIVVEDGPYRDCAWIATELCERSLADVLRDRPGHVLTAPEALRLLDEMLGALAAAHGGGCVHRDVKPANILLHASGAWKLCDFGTARLVPQGSAGGAHPHTGVVGTSPYMSAEAHRGRQDFAADLYALGVTVHEALCGLRLHPRPEGMTDSAYVKLILDTPPTVSPRLDPQWRSLVEALIGRHGPRSAAELRDQLRRQAGTLAAAPTEYLAGPLDPRASGHAGQAEAETPTRQDLATPPRPPEPRTLRHPGSPAPAPRPIPRRPRRRWLDTPDARRHKIGLGALVLGSLAVAGVLLHTLVASALAVAAVIGAVLLAILVLLALS